MGLKLLKQTSKLSLEAALHHSLKEIEHALGGEVVGLERVVKAYGANANSFLVKVVLTAGGLRTYILKFGRGNSIEEEVNGTSFLGGHLRIPELVFFSKKMFF